MDIVEVDESTLCMMHATLPLGRSRYCSKPKGHDPLVDQHVAYAYHNVTGSGQYVMWLGPWDDDTPYETEEAVRLEMEWSNRRHNVPRPPRGRTAEAPET